jgi:methyltransferase (TIGR00027 family)
VEGVAATSLVTAASRASESARPDALFIDPWADLLAGAKGREFLQRHEDVLRATTPIFVVRHRFFDDFLVNAASRGLQQIVLVAAGLDTRAFRLVWPAETGVFEVDQPQVLAYKQEILDRAGAAPTCARVPVAADLREDWPAILLAAGFRPDEPTVWLAEGLLFYLPEAAVRALLTSMASLSAPASVLGTDTMSATMLASEERRAWVQLYKDSGSTLRFRHGLSRGLCQLVRLESGNPPGPRPRLPLRSALPRAPTTRPATRRDHYRHPRLSKPQIAQKLDKSVGSLRFHVTDIRQLSVTDGRAQDRREDRRDHDLAAYDSDYPSISSRSSASSRWFHGGWDAGLLYPVQEPSTCNAPKAATDGGEPSDRLPSAPRATPSQR